MEARLAVESVGTAASNALLVSGKGEHRERHGDGDVDTNLAGFNVLLETGGSGAGAGEDGGAVAVFILVDQVDGVVQSVDGETDQDGAEDLLLVACHLGSDVGDDGGADLKDYGLDRSH